MQQPTPPTPRPLTLADILLPPKSRAMLLGTTGSGKSTLAEILIAQWTRQPGARILIADSKPRFRAEYHLSGLTAKGLYKKWDHGTPPVAGSYLIPCRDPRAELREVWRLAGKRPAIAIAQCADQADLYKLRAAIDAFYGDAAARYKQLLYVDEVADFFNTSGFGKQGDGILKVVRSGREKGVSFLGGSQRPRGVPKSLLTELTQMYIFELAYDDDMDHLREMKMPADAAPPQEEHTFYFYNKPRRLGGYARLGPSLARGA